MAVITPLDCEDTKALNPVPPSSPIALNVPYPVPPFIIV